MPVAARSTLKQKVWMTFVAMASVVLAAIGTDFVMNVLVFRTPLGFTPFNTLMISLIVGTPVCYFLISQRIDLQLVKEQLSETLAFKDAAVRESLSQRQDAERAHAKAEAALAVKSDFLANMTHELRTPLNAIIGFSGLLKDSEDLSPRDARRINLIWDASRTLLAVVNDVLDFSKLEAGAIELDQHPFDPAELAQAAAALLTPQAEAKNLTLSVRVSGLQGPLIGDGPRLRQVLLNFISNAIKFTPSGEVAIEARQTKDGAARRLRLQVRDSGIGVAPEQAESIFGRFIQADASVSRQFGGTGLGLAICKRIIEAFGGEIGVESVVGEGSTFWFEVALPIASDLALVEPVKAAPKGPDRALRLLVVDDNAINRELIAALLTPFDLNIETAQNGVEAVQAAQQHAYDLILMDVQMPIMDGLTATRRIRDAAAGQAPCPPIIAMTANVLPEQIERCLEAGMDDHLGKPINPHDLLDAIGRWTAPADRPDRQRAARSRS